MYINSTYDWNEITDNDKHFHTKVNSMLSTLPKTLISRVLIKPCSVPPITLFPDTTVTKVHHSQLNEYQKVNSFVKISSANFGQLLSVHQPAVLLILEFELS